MMREWPNLNEGQLATVADVFAASRRLANVANDLLAFSNAGESVGFKEDLVNFNIRDAIDLVIGNYLQQAELAGLNIYINIPSNIMLDVFGAKSRLIQVLDHLLSNAVKFTPSGYILVQACVSSAIRLFLYSAHFFIRFGKSASQP